MPTRAMQRCESPGCGIPSPARYCAKHKREPKRAVQLYDARRGSAHARGYGSRGRWMKLRGLVIARDPLCQIKSPQDLALCTYISTVADHKIPKAAGGDDSMDNLQGGCAPCHGWKTRMIDPGLIAEYRTMVARVAVVTGYSKRG
jgi:5-methylcytosine-specific restriction protein A